MIDNLRDTHCEHCGKLSQSNWDQVQELESNISDWSEEERESVKNMRHNMTQAFMNLNRQIQPVLNILKEASKPEEDEQKNN